MLVFTRQWDESFDPSSRKLIWAQVEGFAYEDYGPHMFVLEVDGKLPQHNQGFLVTGETPSSDYTYGLTTMGGKTWVSVAPASIIRWKYLGKMGQVKASPREQIESIPLSPVEVVAHGSKQFTFRVCGHKVAVCFNRLEVLVRPVGGDIESANKLRTLLKMHLFP
jgi:hypothetical protein